MTGPRPGQLVGATYVAVVAALTAFAFRPGADGFNVAEGVAAALTLPMIIPSLPVIYVVGALAWNLGGTDSGDPTLLVTFTFTALMTAVAIANVWLFSLVWRWLRSRRQLEGDHAHPSRERPPTSS
jgi:hypothetical protein